jgi:hypothetical protein
MFGLILVILLIEKVKKKPDKPFPTNNINKIDLNKLYVNRIKSDCKPFYFEDNYNLKKCSIELCFYGSKKIMNKFIDSYIEIVKTHLKNNMSLCADQDLFKIVIQKYNIPIYDFNIDVYDLMFI